MSLDTKEDNQPAKNLGNSIYLRSIDPLINKFRFYAMYIQDDLWGGVSLVRENGRIGQPGKVVINWYPKINEAITTMNKISREKQNRGYRASRGPNSK